MRRAVLLLIVVAFLLLTPYASEGSTSTSYNLSPSVLASGGQATSSVSYSLVSTIGQPLIGGASSPSYSVGNGFWSQVQSLFRVFMPVVMKNY